MQKKKSKKYLAWLLAVAMLLSGLPAQQTQAAKATKLSNKKITITVGKSKTLKLKNNKKKTTWKIVSGKKCIKLKNKKKNSVKIVALKKGKAKVQVKAGKKKYTCTVTVKAAKKQNKKTTTKAPSAGNMAKATQKPSVTGNPLPTKTPNTTKEPSATGKPAVTRSEWIAAVMNTTEFQSQENLFDYDGGGNVSYSFTDIKNDANADLIETAVKYGIIPDAGGEFRPDDAADREFLAVTSVRAVGFAIEESKSDYYDKADLKYEMEDVVAVQLELVKLSDNRFLPTQAITSAEKQNAVRILSDIVKSHDIDEKHTDVIEYNEEVADEKDVTDYTISEKDGVYTVMTANGTSLDNVSEGDKIILPAVDGYPEGMALIVRSNDTSSDGENRILTGTAPDNITEFVDNMDIEGKADIDGNNVTAVDGVSDVEVSKNDEENTLEKNANGLKQAKIDGEIALQDKTKFCFTIKEIDTTISFCLSELQYRVDFDKKGVNDLYIGLPSVLSMDTNCKANKNFSGKIGEIPINLGEGFTANIEVYLETSISGEITINLTLSNNVGMHYYKGQFYVIKSCEPSFDAVVDADIDAGAKLQLGLYWMKGIKEIFGKTDSRPVYNVNTKWGIHGDATLHIRNDQYTAYENLSCVDLAYYLYGNISVGDGSFLGEQFDLKKSWVVYNAQNSPLKGAWHIENRKRVEACTYNNGEMQTVQDALNAYKDMLSKSEVTVYRDSTNSIEIDASDCKFAIVYVDSDLIPELLVEGGSGTYHATGSYNLFKYEDNEIKYVNNTHDYFTYYEKTGIYSWSYAGMGENIYEYLDIKDSNKKVFSRVILYGEAMEYEEPIKKYYKYSGTAQQEVSEEISVSEYNILVDELCKGAKEESPELYLNTKENREKYFIIK